MCGGDGGAGAPLARCRTCGGLAHARCLSRGECELCEAGVDALGAVLGSRNVSAVAGAAAAPAAGAAAALAPRREYFIQPRGAAHIHCRWVTAAAARRLERAVGAAVRMVAAFDAKRGGAPAPAPAALLAEWTTPERVLAERAGEALIKWGGLPHERATWEPAGAAPAALRAAAAARRALRLPRDAAAEAAAARRPPPRLAPGAPPPPPAAAAAKSLRGFQAEGVDWLLARLAAREEHAILADEMGLGKTVQTAVFLSEAYRARLLMGPTVVVAPLGTLGGWERELALWAPELAVVPYHGSRPGRALIQEHELGGRPGGRSGLEPRCHVLLAAPDQVRADAALLATLRPSLLVVDEAHLVRRPGARAATALRALEAPVRVLLTGTPLQNSVGELFGLLAFLEGRSPEEVEEAVRALPDPAPELAAADAEALAEAEAASAAEAEAEAEAAGAPAAEEEEAPAAEAAGAAPPPAAGACEEPPPTVAIEAPADLPGDDEAAPPGAAAGAAAGPGVGAGASRARRSCSRRARGRRGRRRVGREAPPRLELPAPAAAARRGRRGGARLRHRRARVRPPPPRLPRAVHALPPRRARARGRGPAQGLARAPLPPLAAPAAAHGRPARGRVRARQRHGAHCGRAQEHGQRRRAAAPGRDAPLHLPRAGAGGACW
jgi:hypothetical protein